MNTEEEFKLEQPPVDTPRRRKSTKLGSQDICDILKSCSACNIKSLKYGGLELEFHHSGEKQNSASPVYAQTEQMPTQDSSFSRMHEDLLEDSEDLEELMVSDPLKAEQQLSRALDGSAEASREPGQTN